jgi:hypothetical protein
VVADSYRGMPWLAVRQHWNPISQIGNVCVKLWWVAGKARRRSIPESLRRFD